MRILLPTGAATAETVRRAAAGFDADVVVTGKIASFLTPHALRELIQKSAYDAVVVSGMCTVSFEQVERETGVPVYRGPRHAADLAGILPLVGKVPLSRTVPADDFLAAGKAKDAMALVVAAEKDAEPEFVIRGVKIGGNARMKVLAEIMDAHRVEDIAGRVEAVFFPRGGYRRSRLWLRCDPGRCETGVFWNLRRSMARSPWTRRTLT